VAHDRVDVEVVLCLRALLHDRCFHAREVDERGDLHPVVLRVRRSLDALESRNAEERDLHRRAAVDAAGQRVSLLLKHRRALEEGNAPVQLGRVEVPAAEIKVDRLSVPEMQRDRRAAIEHKLLGDVAELVPQHALRLRKGVEIRSKHTSPVGLRTRDHTTKARIL
jgi:hypothetical protein